MNYTVIAHTKTVSSYQASTKNNPEYQKKANGPTNNASFRKRYKIIIPNTKNKQFRLFFCLKYSSSA